MREKVILNLGQNKEKEEQQLDILTDEWKNRGATVGRDYAIFTNEIYRTGFGVSVGRI